MSDAKRSIASRKAINCACLAMLCGAFHARKFVHGGVTDLTLDRLVPIQHGELERQTFVVVSYNSAPGQRHRTTIFQMA